MTPPTPWSSRRGIKASAGSGKTYNLAGYYLAAFLRGAEPSALLATTFTRKAAGEILGRVLARLAAACEDPTKLRELSDFCQLERELTLSEAQAHLRRLCLNLHQISIFTIDSFFGRLLTGFQHELGLPGQFKAVDESSPEMQLLRTEAIVSMLAGADTSVDEVLDVLHGGKAQRAIVQDLEEKLVKPYEIFLTSRPEAWDFASWPRTAPIPVPLSTQELSLAVNALESAIGSYGTLDKVINEDLARFRAENWGDFPNKGLAKPVRLETNAYNKRSIPDELCRLYPPLLTHARAQLIEGHIQYSRALYRVLSLLHNQFGERVREGGLMAFRDVPLLLANFMDDVDTGELSHRMDSRIGGVLLDEFQDTDPLQYRILKPFARRIDTGPANDGVLFCVGDMKQSIYGWRGAVPQIFNRFSDDMPTVRWDGLQKSYRSSAVILETVNRVFENLATNRSLNRESYATAAAAHWGEDFVPHTTARDHAGYVELLEFPVADPSDGDDEPEAANPYEDWVASEVQRIWSNTPNRSVAVLLRTNLAARTLTEKLKSLGVPATSEGGGDIRDDPAVALILSAFRFADHPGDTAAACHLLNSPLAETLRLGQGGRDETDLAALIIRRRLGQGGASPLVTEWATVLARASDERGAHRLQQLVSLADAYDREPGTRPIDFVTFVDSQDVPDPAAGGVQVMTLHKSKGLEFDVVILPEVHKSLPGRSPALLYGRDSVTHEIDRVTAWPKTEVAEADPVLFELRQNHFQREIQEALCLLYVGLTRPRRALHVLIPPQEDHKNGQPRFNMAAWLCCALEEIRTPTPSGARRLYEHGSPHWWTSDPPSTPSVPRPKPALHLDPATLDSWPGRVHTRKRPSRETAEDQTEETLLPERLHDFDTVDARRRGLALHSILELLEWTEIALPSQDKLAHHARLAVPGLTQKEAESLVVRLWSALAHPEIATALSRAAFPDGVELHRECDLSVYLSDNFEGYTDARLDRLVVQRESGRPIRAWIQDFKSDLITPESVPAAARLYTAQMGIYRQAVSKALNLPSTSIAASLIFLEPGKVVQI